MHTLIDMQGILEFTYRQDARKPGGNPHRRGEKNLKTIQTFEEEEEEEESK